MRGLAGFAVWIPRAAVLMLAWGALAIGGVLPWAYWPLLAACGVCAAASFVLTRSLPIDMGGRALAFSLAAVAVVIAAQLIPVPLTLLSPDRVNVLRNLDPAVMAGSKTRHAASIAPADTVRGLLFIAAFVLFTAGLVRAFAVTGARTFVKYLTALGVLLAVIGIVQKPIYAGRILGLWEPSEGVAPFGTFVNKNHFAGWMLMAIPMTLALVCRAVSRVRLPKGNLLTRLLWFGSADANRIVVFAAAAGIMALALVLTMSRSAIIGLGVALVITAFVLVRHQRGAGRKAVLLAYLILLAAGVVWWAGDALFHRFAIVQWTEFDGRKDIWLETIDIIRRFPLFGSGFNTFVSATMVYQTRVMDVQLGEAHNDYLQLLAEGGIPLALAVAVCIAVFAREVRRRFRTDAGSAAYWLRVGAVTGLLAMALQETVEFSLHIPGDAILFASLCAIALHRPEHRRAAVGS